MALNGRPEYSAGAEQVSCFIQQFFKKFFEYYDETEAILYANK